MTVDTPQEGTPEKLLDMFSCSGQVGMGEDIDAILSKALGLPRERIHNLAVSDRDALDMD